jgi:hypothetical protein
MAKTRPIIELPKDAALAQFLGYELQLLRACSYLFNQDSAANVYIEYLDDVCVVFPSKNILVEQDKRIFSTNPISDWSIDLWKTLYNWITKVVSGQLDVDRTTFRIYVVPKNRANFAWYMHSATTEAHADQIIKTITREYQSKKNLSRVQKYVVFSLFSNRHILQKIIPNMEVLSPSGDPMEEFKNQIQPLTPNSDPAKFCQIALGLAHTFFVESARSGVAKIRVSEFQKEWHHRTQKLVWNNLLPSSEQKPSTIEVNHVFAQRRDFVKQMEDICLPDDEVIEGITNFIMSYNDRVSWTLNGEVHRSSVTDFEEELVRKHRNIFRKITSVHKDVAPEEQGKVILSECCLEDCRLEDRPVPGYFIEGSYHNLADDYRVWWHPCNRNKRS